MNSRKGMTVENKFRAFHIIPAMSFAALAVLSLLLAVSAFPVRDSYAHFSHLTHYNGRGDTISPYYVYEELNPEYASPKEPTQIAFSVQDDNGRDVSDVTTMVEVYSALTGERIKAFPWTHQVTGDFAVYYTFPEVGSYQIVLSIARGPVIIGNVDDARSSLGSTLNCNCERGVFNVSITEGFETIFNTAMLLAVLLPLTIVGLVLGLVYRRRRKMAHEGRGKKLPTEEIIKYIVMLTAIAGGLVHFAVYSDHGLLRLEYSIFLISAGGFQIAYGVMYVLLTLMDNSTYRSRLSAREFYRKTVAVNLFGLVGTAVLLGLYIYAVTFPPPLSPNNTPEDVDLAGILAKSVEVFLVIGIVYLMRMEKKRMQQVMAQVK